MDKIQAVTGLIHGEEGEQKEWDAGSVRYENTELKFGGQDYALKLTYSQLVILPALVPK